MSGMFVAPKPLASLSSGLLARKGQARPAMRPQGYATPSPAPPDDLGWNDMGTAPAAPELPPVLVERAALKDEVEQVEPVAVAPEPVEPEAVAPEPAAPEPVMLAPALPEPRAVGRGKAAFTLRITAERHLRLRLASAVTHQSSQALLTQALDSFLDTLPEVEALARQCARPTGDPA